MHGHDDNSDDDEDEDEDTEADPPLLACCPSGIHGLVGVVEARDLSVDVENRIIPDSSPSFNILLDLLHGVIDNGDLLVLLFHKYAHLRSKSAAAGGFHSQRCSHR